VLPLNSYALLPTIAVFILQYYTFTNKNTNHAKETIFIVGDDHGGLYN
jgi:hypothetical protein